MHPATPATLVSVVVPVMDDEARLKLCLEALDRQSLEEPFEVIVVDNGSRVSPAPTVEAFARATLLHHPCGGSYAARNAGAARAAGAVLAFTDSDCVPHEGWLEAGVAALAAAGDRSFVGGRVEVRPRSAQHPTAVELWDTLHGFPQQRYVEDLSFAVTANLLVSREAFELTGGFDDALRSSGDREWGQRATATGVVASYSDAVVVDHPARRSISEVRKKVRRVNRGAAALEASNGSTPLGHGPARMFLRPPLRSVGRRAVTLGPWRGARYAAVALLIHYLTALERARR